MEGNIFLQLYRMITLLNIKFHYEIIKLHIAGFSHRNFENNFFNVSFSTHFS